MSRKVLWLIIGCYLAVLGVLALSLYTVSLRPSSQEVWRLAIGPYYEPEEVAYISGRYLNCAPSPAQAWEVSCTLEVLGQPLALRIRRNPNGQCAAFYTGKQWLCRILWSSEPAPVFTYLDEPLGLNKSQLDALHRQYLPESDIFLNDAMIFAISNGLLLLTVLGLWLRSHASHKVLGAVLITACALATWGISFFAGALLTGIIWG